MQFAPPACAQRRDHVSDLLQALDTVEAAVAVQENGGELVRGRVAWVPDRLVWMSDCVAWMSDRVASVSWVVLDIQQYPLDA
eukprot:316612-Chlamydomonas_euryale.AAC.4